MRGFSERERVLAGGNMGIMVMVGSFDAGQLYRTGVVQ
jgi:hypothetical protein